MPKPSPTDFIDVAVLSSDVAVVVGQKQILRTTDAGETYWPVELNHSGNFASVCSTDNPEVAWLLTKNGQVFRSTDGGAEWNEVKSADEVENSSFFALSEQKAWVSESNGLLLATSDAGDHWDTVANGPDFSFSKFLFVNDNIGFAIPLTVNAGTDDVGNTLLRTVDGGNYWDTIAVVNSRILLLESYDQAAVWYADNEKLYTSYDAGDSWYEVDLPGQKAERYLSLAATSSTEFFLLMHFANDDFLYSKVFSTEEGGEHWNEEYSAYISGMWAHPYDPVFINVLDGKEGVFYAVGTGSHILTKKGDGDWMMKSKNITGEVWDLMFVDKDNGFGSGYGPFLFKTHDGGNTWESDETLPDSLRYNFRIWFSDLTTGYVLNNEEGLFKTIDGGDTWLKVFSEGDGQYSDFFFINNTTGWVLQTDGSLYKTTDAGETWDKLVTLEPANHEWRTLFFVDEHTGVATFDPNNITLENGGIVKITDGNITSTVNIENYTSVYKIARSNDGTLWAACSKGLIYKSTDEGETWHTIDQLLGNGGHPVLDIMFLTSAKGYALCSLYGLYKTEDGGDHWSLDTTCLLNGFMDLSGLATNGSDLFVYAEKEIVKNAGVVGVNQLHSDGLEGLTVWPNPAGNILSVSASGIMSKLVVFDVGGRAVITVNPKTKRYNLNVENLPAGVWFVKAVTESGEENGKFVKE